MPRQLTPHPNCQTNNNNQQWSGITFRRITGSTQKPWTFHVGIGLWGGKSIPWRERATKEPRYTLFLAANWFMVSGGMQGWAREWTEAPAVCTLESWRDYPFCNAQDSSYCRGEVRLGCIRYQNPGARDNVWYREQCEELRKTRKLGKLHLPFCEFCNFLLSPAASGPSFANAVSSSTLSKRSSARIRGGSSGSAAATGGIGGKRSVALASKALKTKGEVFRCDAGKPRECSLMESCIYVDQVAEDDPAV